MVDKFKSSGPPGDEDLQTGVFTASTDLFYFYRQNLVAMAKLNTRKPFLDLSKLFAKWLLLFAEVLNSKLPKCVRVLIVWILVKSKLVGRNGDRRLWKKSK
jgi:hypothetical protein